MKGSSSGRWARAPALPLNLPECWPGAAVAPSALPSTTSTAENRVAMASTTTQLLLARCATQGLFLLALGKRSCRADSHTRWFGE
eukprot:9396263-Pyramimonas_sp.AAC.1